MEFFSQPLSQQCIKKMNHWFINELAYICVFEMNKNERINEAMAEKSLLNMNTKKKEWRTNEQKKNFIILLVNW